MMVYKTTIWIGHKKPSRDYFRAAFEKFYPRSLLLCWLFFEMNFRRRRRRAGVEKLISASGSCHLQTRRKKIWREMREMVPITWAFSAPFSHWPELSPRAKPLRIGLSISTFNGDWRHHTPSPFDPTRPNAKTWGKNFPTPFWQEKWTVYNGCSITEHQLFFSSKKNINTAKIIKIGA